MIDARVETVPADLETACQQGRYPDWLRPALAHLVSAPRRLGDGLYHCYDVPGLPRTDNALKQFYRRVKASERVRQCARECSNTLKSPSRQSSVKEAQLLSLASRVSRGALPGLEASTECRSTRKRINCDYPAGVLGTWLLRASPRKHEGRLDATGGGR